MAKRIKDPDILAILGQFIDSYHTSCKSGIGIPLGNQTSQWFALYYMSHIDHFIKETLGIKGYIRYMDDFVLVGHDKQYLQHCKIAITNKLHHDLLLKLNPKSDVFKVSRSVEFLGWRFFMTKKGQVVRRLKVSSKKRIRRGLGQLSRDYACGRLGFGDVRQGVASYQGHLKHGNTHYLTRRLMSEISLEFGIHHSCKIGQHIF